MKGGGLLLGALVLGVAVLAMSEPAATPTPAEKKPTPPPPSSGATGTKVVGGCAIEASFPYDQDLAAVLSESMDTSQPVDPEPLTTLATRFENEGYPLAGACLRRRADAVQSQEIAAIGSS